MSGGYRLLMTASLKTRTCATLALVLACTGVWMGLNASAAAAHAALVSSDPADGSVLTAPLPKITLTFDEALLQSVDTISINDASGNVVVSQEVNPDGAVLSIPWPANLPSGVYEVAYRAVADDGHPMIGAVHFTLSGQSSTTASTSATGAPAASVSAAPAPAPAPGNTTSTGLSNLTLGIILLAVLVVFGFVLTVRRRKRT